MAMVTAAEAGIGKRWTIMRERILRMHEKERNADRSGAFRGVPDRSETVSEAITVRKWYEKQEENGFSDRWKLEKLIVFAVLLSVAILTAYKAKDAAGVEISVLMLAVYSIAADPLALTRRKAARNSRYILAAGLLPVFAIIWKPTPRTVIVAAAIFLLAFGISFIGNKHWRAAESYKMSRHVVKALQPTDNTDQRDICLTAWQADGAREVTAAAAEMGAYACDEIEMEVRHAAFTIGFCRASTISRQHEKERTAALMDAARVSRENEELRAQLAEMDDLAANLDDYKTRLARAERMATEGAAAIKEKMDALEEIRNLKRTIKDLEEANETLVKTAENPLIAAEAAEHLKEQRLKEAAEKGFSVSQTEAYANVSHRKAYEYLKAYWEKYGKKGDARTKTEKRKAG